MEIVWTFPPWKMSMEFMDSKTDIYTIEFSKSIIWRAFFIMYFYIFFQPNLQKIAPYA